MKKYRFLHSNNICFVWLLLLTFYCNNMWAQYDVDVKTNHDSNTVFRLHSDLIYLSDNDLCQDIQILVPQKTISTIDIKCYWYKSDSDSILVYRSSGAARSLNQGVNNIKVKFKGNTEKSYVLPSFAKALNRTGDVPPGNYRLQIILHGDNENTFAFIYDIDTALSFGSAVRKDINNLLAPEKYNFLGRPVKIASSLDKASLVFNRSKYKIARYCKKRGLVAEQYPLAGKEVIDLYSDEWFAGRYEMDSSARVSDVIHKEQKDLKDNVEDFTKNELGNFKSLATQFRELKEDAKEDRIQGQIAISTNVSSGQEPESDQENNYYEAAGTVALPLFNIPFNVSGYYTSQDRNREAKSSYIHLSYDADKAKEQLFKLIKAYNKKYAQALSQGGSYDMIYGQYIEQLQQQKNNALATLKKETGINDLDISNFDKEYIEKQALLAASAAKDKVLDTLADIADRQKDKIIDSLKNTASGSDIAKDAAATVDKAKEAELKTKAAYAKAMEKYREILELERKIEKYSTLLSQYKNTIFYDSLMAYGKLGSMKDISNMSYKDMSKKASALLPEGKVKSVITGLTNFDAGMFSKYVSDYTMSGQMQNGLDIGYDAGFANIGGSYGKTQYIDRDGAVEDYKMYSMRAMFKPLWHQQFGLIYMGYSPATKLSESPNFLKDADISVPSFKKPVQIVSATYTGMVGKLLSLAGEYAISHQYGQQQTAAASISFNQRSSYNIKATTNIPATTILLEAGYEHTGNAFTNNTLPVIMAGTDKVAISAKGDLFRSFLTLGVEYNLLLQNSFYSKAKNSRWGFDMATHSKRYPTISLSYKPFSTFRSINDTLSIAQKPILGEVWTGKLSYQIKKKDRALRFMLLYNRNRSLADSMQYRSSLMQFSTMFTRKTTLLSLSIGNSDINTDYFTTRYPIYNKSSFMNIAAAGNVLRNIMLNGGANIASAKIGLSKYGMFAGFAYSFPKMPLMLKCNFRYNNFRLDEGGGWKALYSGNLQLAWKFSMKIWD